MPRSPIRTLLLLLATTGCADPTEDEPPSDPERVCDIREGACQQRALDLAVMLRDASSRPDVNISVVDAAAFVADEEARGKTQTLSPDERLLRRGLALVGASTVPTDRGGDVRPYYEHVGAFYDHKTRAITILDRGEPMDAIGVFTLLVHELTHALQGADGLFDRERQPTNLDAVLAARSMTEGEAMLIQWLAFAKVRGWSSIDWQGSIERLRMYYQDSAAKSTDLYRDRYPLFVYDHGLSYVYDAYAIGGMSEVRRVLSEGVPSSTIDVMRGYRPSFSYPQTIAAEKVLVARTAAPWRMAGVAHLGGWFLDHVTNRLNAPFSWEDTLRGDSLTLFEVPSETGGEPDVALYWRVELEEPADSKYLSGKLPHLVTWLDRAAFIAARSGSPEGAPPAGQVSWEGQAQADLFFGTQAKTAAADLVLHCGRHRSVPLRGLQP